MRQAIAYAIDRKFVIDNIWFGFGKPATGPISSNFKANGIYTADVRNYNVPDGVEMANKLLDEAGYKRGADGTRFEIMHDITPYGEEWRRFGEYVQQQLGKLGIKMTLRYEDVPTWLRRIYTNYDFDTDQQLDPDARRSGDRRAPALSLEVDQARHGLRQRHALELAGDRQADERGDGRDRSQEARGALPRVPEEGRRGEPARVGDGARLRHGLQQEAAGLAGEPAGPVLLVRPGLAGQVARHEATWTRHA